jgi:hypothetical protein
MKKVGVLAIILGIVLLGGSFYIKAQVQAGLEQIHGVEKNMDMGNKLFSLSPASKAIGDQASKPIQEKVKEGKEQVEFYTALADWLAIGGVVLVILGLLLFFCKK